MTRSKKKPVKRGGGERRDLVRESAWIRVYQVKPNLYIQSSKFLDDGLELKASEFEKTWPELSPQEKLDVCLAYHAKPIISEEDEKILNIIMRSGEDVTWRNIASVLTRHPDRTHAAEFIRNRIEKQSPPLANFYQAIETLRDSKAIPQLRTRYAGYVNAGVTPQSPDRILCIDYLACCRALWKLTNSPEYKRAIESFLHAQDGIVRDTAQRQLE